MGVTAATGQVRTMDPSITAAGRALCAGDPLGALKRVALRDDPAALALRGIAMAQLADLRRARELLRRAARGFGPRETLARARCLTAEAEVALAARDLGAWSPRALSEALRTFDAHGDRARVRAVRKPRRPSGRVAAAARLTSHVGPTCYRIVGRKLECGSRPSSGTSTIVLTFASTSGVPNRMSRMCCGHGTTPLDPSPSRRSEGQNGGSCSTAEPAEALR
jgi:hypothetical protein